MSVTGFINDLVKSIYVDSSGIIYVRLASAGTAVGSTPTGFVTDFIKQAVVTDSGGNNALSVISTQ
jgi:hypothetical protein